MTDKAKQRLVAIWYTAACIGVLDMAGQALTKGEFKLIHAILGTVFD